MKAAQPVRMESSSGDMEVTDLVTPELTVETISGEARLYGLKSSLVHSSSSGDLLAEFAEPGNRIFSDVTSGGVDIVLPGDTSFSLRFDTSSGDFQSDFPLTVTGQLDGDNIRGSVGHGDRDVKVESSSGDLSIKSF